MRRCIAYAIGIAIAICGLGVLLIVVGFGRDTGDFLEWVFFDDTKKQMDAGKKYMDSLTDKDIQSWIQRTQKYLAEGAPANYQIGVDPFPPDLQKLGMTGIEVWPDEVDYVWLGGMDNTALAVDRMSNGDFQVIAVYTPYSNRMIWPRQVP